MGWSLRRAPGVFQARTGHYGGRRRFSKQGLVTTEGAGVSKQGLVTTEGAGVFQARTVTTEGAGVFQARTGHYGGRRGFSKQGLVTAEPYFPLGVSFYLHGARGTCPARPAPSCALEPNGLAPCHGGGAQSGAHSKCW